ncbi:MAG: radical SAM protein, partial [Pseudomonadota bacterium]
MVKASREFQIFAKPGGSICNLDCHYCYYLKKEHLYPKGESFRMPDSILEKYIIQHIDASSDSVVNFSWHGGEPTLLGLDYFRKIVELQRKHQPPNQRITNGIQTNGTLL